MDILLHTGILDLQKLQLMNDFFARYVDNVALLLCVLIPLAITIQLKRRTGKKLRAFPLYFFVFGPIGIMTFMFFHLFDNSYHAVEAAVKGAFQYSFRFYSLILFGLVVSYMGLQLLRISYRRCLEEQSSYKAFFMQSALIIAVTAPLIPLTPIASVPSLCCIISSLAIAFVRRSRESLDRETANNERVFSAEGAMSVAMGE